MSTVPMRSESAVEAILLTSLPMPQCEGCGAPFAPKRPWQKFCSAGCRKDYHLGSGPAGTVKAVRRLKSGWSVVVHMPDASGLELGTGVKVVRAA